ncbi:MAG: rhamnogalacturonan acetylesterase [Erysipelotrichaceae bacterium]|nr:rhamnogalacturonan acetylesterase [Erysipelotrichaceae bacterium]
MKIVCMGDSTMQYNDETTFPQVGWPQALEELLNKDVRLMNFAKNGRSTKTFMEEGRFEDALRFTDKDSIVLIEFGHNDEHDYDPKTHTRPDFEYHDNLKYMVEECKKKGAYVLLCTPIYRRMFLQDGTLDPKCHAGYQEAMIRVASETGVNYVDLTSLTKKKIEETGVEESKEYFMNFASGVYENYPEGKSDNTHLRMKGARMVRDLFIDAVRKDPNFKECFNV